MSKLHVVRPALRHLVLLSFILAIIGIFAGASAQPKPQDDPADAGLQNVSTLDMGATAKGSGAAFNQDWPANNALQGPGTIFDSAPKGSNKGARIDIRLIVPVDIKALEVVPLEYHGTQQPKSIDIYIDGKEAMKDVQLPHNPGLPFRIPLEAHGQNVGIHVTDEYPPEAMPNGSKGAEYGGFARLRVMSSTDVASMLKLVDNYNVPASPDNIALTSGSAANGKPVVSGQPRVTVGHPCTLWDKEDIAHYQKMLGTSKELKDQYESLKKAMDIRISQPLGIPEPQKNEKGEFIHISDAKLAPGGTATYGAIHNQLGLDIANLGEVYALSGEAKYGEFCKKLLLAYADAFPKYGVGSRPGPAYVGEAGIIFDQRLSDAIWLVPVARGYDLIHDLPSISPEERKHIEDDFVKADARFIVGNHAYMEAPTNWSAYGTCAVLAAGYATDDQGLINTAYYGIDGTKEKPTGGLYDRHFSEKSITQDGLWVEGSVGYQFMALQALIMDAEMMWHHGVDMYSYRGGDMKRLFDSPIESSYPDLTTPAIHDGGHGSIVGADSLLYEYAYRRYQDPKYIPILNQIGTHLDTHYQQPAVSVLYDRDKSAKGTPAEWKSVNFFGVGYGILRMTTEAGTTSVLLEYGPAGSHSHPDKMTLDIYAFNDQLMIDPGSVWYEQPLYWRWYRTSLAHPTMIVDELDQMIVSGKQLTYGPADSMGIERGMTDKAYPGVTLDRSIFTTPNYVADLFGGFTRLPRKMDMAYHIRGTFDSQLPLEPMTFPEPVENGYNELTNVRHATTDKAWTANITRAGNVARVVAAGGTQTEVIVANGHYGLETPPTILERRTIPSPLYGNAIDISGAQEPYVKSVVQEGGLDAGYGLLKVTTPKGVDLCFASYRPGSYKAGDLETDAVQAFAIMDGTEVHSLYLAGGKSLKIGSNSLERSAPGLAYLEKADTGGYVLANPSPSEAKVTANIPALKGMEAYNLDSNEKRTGSVEVTKSGDAVTVDFKAMSKVEFAPKGATSIYDYRENLLRKRQDAQEAALAKARNECEARTKEAEAAAKAKPAPANTVLVSGAVDLTGQGGGEVKYSDQKRGAIGKVAAVWDEEGHWLEWTFDAPTEGYYNLSVCYCSESDQIAREIKVNGEVQEPFAPMIFPSTGGWANGSDDWRIYTATNPVSKGPLLLKLKQGKNVIRLTNTNGRGINVNYVAVTSPDVKITRELLAAKASSIASKPNPDANTLK